MSKSGSPPWPEVDILAILKLYGIEPCEKRYQTFVGDRKPSFLVSEGVCVPYKTRDLGKVKIKNSVMAFKAVVVNENGKEKGVGICYEVIEGGRGGGTLNCGSNYWDDPKDGIGIVGFLSELKKLK
jgi:hypothetical protein